MGMLRNIYGSTAPFTAKNATDFTDVKKILEIGEISGIRGVLPCILSCLSNNSTATKEVA
jgi:hypothetical protein